jgi:hypothetical protein
VAHSDYRSYLIKAEGINYPSTLVDKPLAFGIYPNIHGVKNEEGKFVKDVFGRPVLGIRPYGDSDTMVVYVHGDPTISEETIRKNIVEDFKKAGATEVSVIKGEKWYYFPRPKGDVESTIKSLKDVQGVGGV